VLLPPVVDFSRVTHYVTDVRNETTTYGYNYADQIASVTTPSTTPGRPPQTTITDYNTSLRAWKITQPDGELVFNELTQFYHLEHCCHHEPVAMLAQMLIRMLGFLLFSAYAVLHSQKVRLGQTTMKELAHDLAGAGGRPAVGSNEVPRPPSEIAAGIDLRLKSGRAFPSLVPA
jgi:hypothetical protein